MSMMIGSVDWVALGTLGAAMIAAAAALYAGWISRQQLTIARRARELEHPLIEAVAHPVNNQPEWTRLTIFVRNRANVSLEITGVKMRRPKDILLLGEDQALMNAEEPWRPRNLVDPLPAEKSSADLRLSRRLGRADYPDSEGLNVSVVIGVYAHLPLSLLQKERSPKVILALRWRDQAASTFTIAASVIRPSTI